MRAPLGGNGARTPKRRCRQRFGWSLAAALLFLAVAVAGYRQPLAERLWPSARIDRLLAEGAQALAQGRLDSPGGDGARQAFEAALALDGDRGEARRGLARVADAALIRAGAAIDAGDRDGARRWLALAAELQAPRARWDAVRADLRRAEAEAVDLEALRAEAAGHLAAGDPDAALPLYARVLALAPDDAGALEGREDALAMVLERVHRALRSDALRAAVDGLALARRYDPGHADLPAAQAQVARTLDAARRRADAWRRRGRLDRAAEAYAALRAAAAEDAAIAEGARRVAGELAERAAALSGGMRFEAAERDLARARILAPDAEAVVEAARRLAADRAAARTRLAGQAPRPAAGLRPVMQAFDAAMAHQRWIEPPGASAYDHLRAAQALAPESAEVRDAAGRLRAGVRGCMEAAMDANRLRQAQACHDAWRAVAPDDPDRDAARQRLAQGWLAVGEERLRAGELEAAARALAAARRSHPGAAGMSEFAARLERAGHASRAR